MIDASVSISGKTITIPPRLFRAISAADQENNQATADVSSIEDVDDLLESEQKVAFAPAIYIKAACPLMRDRPTTGILLLAIFASLRAIDLRDQGKPQAGLGLLADALILEHQTLPYCDPPLTRKLSRRIAYQTEETVELSAFIGSVDAVVQTKDDLETVFSIMEAVWEPEFRAAISTLMKIPFSLADVGHAEKRQQIQLLRSIRSTLVGVKKDIEKGTPSKNPSHPKLLANLVASWQEILQQEIVLSASAQYSSEGLDYDSISRQAYRLIGQVEQRLRLVIAERYEKQYGAAWVEHIQAKHKFMYEHWLANMQKDRTAFKAYSSHSPELLEYARFDDLVELIGAQWHLFRDLLDFRADTRNKAVFADKMSQIAIVRNPLAHNRSIPENELLRARVLCTDILLALDGAGENPKKDGN